MSGEQNLKGRGAVLKKLAVISTESASVLPRGRAAILSKLKAENEGPTKPRGRAALLAKVQNLQIGSTQVHTQIHLVKEDEKENVPEELPDDLPMCQFTGTSGKEIKLTANYIRMSIEENKGVFEYDVSFDPEVESKNIRIKILNSNLLKLGGVKSFDGGHVLYLPIMLPDKITRINAVHPIDGKPIIMQVRFQKKKNLNQCMHLFNTLFKRIMRTLLMIEFRRDFFDLKSAIMIHQHKLKVLPGFAITCNEFKGGLFLCLDTQHRVLRTQTVYDLMLEIRAVAKERFREEFTKIILGMSVLTNYNNKNYVVDDIMWDLTPQSTFSTSNGKEITYIEYYKTQYNIEIQDQRQPLLLHKQKLKYGPTGADERLICLIPELSHLTGLTDVMRNDFKVMKSIAEHTRLTPLQRVKAIKTYINRVRESPEASKILSDWGLRIEDGTIDVDGRLLNQESIMFGNNKCQVSTKMDWKKELCQSKAIQCVDLNNWVVVYSARDETATREFVNTIKRVGPPMGCEINQPRMIRVPNDRTPTFIQEIRSVITPQQQCVVVISPTLRQDLYSAIKKVCCVEQPIASQVILSKTLKNPQRLRTIVQMIAVQINCKLGGIPWAVTIPVTSAWMVVGIDTYHNKMSKYSVYGFTASLNNNFTRYYSTTVKQLHELGDSVLVCMTKALIKFREVNNKFPEHIIVFRDGVGDGQLDMCRNYELAQLKDCLKKLDVKAGIAFNIVQKRINTRIFTDNFQNPPAGTIVDHTITRKNMFDFYLVSQHTNQGTISPTHYICIENTTSMNPDILQRLSYKLCHLYYNWSGTIRVPAPCQYAHKLAYLVGECLQDNPNEKLSTRLYYL